MLDIFDILPVPASCTLGLGMEVCLPVKCGEVSPSTGAKKGRGGEVAGLRFETCDSIMDAAFPQQTS